MVDEEEEKAQSFQTGAMKDLAGYLDYSDIQKLLFRIANDEESANWKGRGRDNDWLLVFLLSRTGRRISEVLPLKPLDVQWSKQLVQFNILKKRQPLVKLKPVDHTVLEQLDTFMKKWKVKKDDFFFKSPYNSGRHLTRNWAYKRVRHLVEKHLGQGSIGRKYPHPHHFRHSFAINFLENNTKPNALALLQGSLEHSSLNVTGHYLQFSPREQLESLEELFGDKEGLGSDSEFKRNQDTAIMSKKYLNVVENATPNQLKNWRNMGARVKKWKELKDDGYFQPNYVPREEKEAEEKERLRKELELEEERKAKDEADKREKAKDDSKVFKPFETEYLE